ncbi:MAG: four-carbon acid sugar kinase family protein [Pseudomonadota bacterium]
MIFVLADDFSGAGELAGIGAAHGLNAEVWIGFQEVSEEVADLVAIDCGTRTLAEAEAERRVLAIARKVVARRPTWIFKKTDSVLRGHVAIECAAVAAFGYDRVMLVPANPSRGRFVVDGRYLIDGRPLSETAFARDPEFPARSSDVRTLLGRAGDVRIDVPDISFSADIDAIVSGLPDNVLPAGAAEFFTALLRHHQLPIAHPLEPFPGDFSDSLWICGSQAAWSNGLAQTCEKNGIDVALTTSLPKSLPACLAIGEGDGCSSPDTLLEQLIAAALESIALLHPRRLFVEGGATASALCHALGWKRFTVATPNTDGIGILAPFASDAATLFVKPGSYPWPQLYTLT